MNRQPEQPRRADTSARRARIVQAAFAGTAIAVILLGLGLPDVTAGLARLAGGTHLSTGERVAELEAALSGARVDNAGLADRVAALEQRLEVASREAASGALPEPVRPPAELAGSDDDAGAAAADAAFGLAVAAVDDMPQATRMWRELVARDAGTLARFGARLAPAGGDGPSHRIVIGPFATRVAADLTCSRLRAHDIACAHAVFSGRPLPVE